MDVHVTLRPGAARGQAIYEQLRDAMLDGRLRPGERLPPTRELAERLAVSRTTVLAAYDRLVSEGLLETRVGDGTYVAQLDGWQRSRAQTPGDRADGPAPRARWGTIPAASVFDRAAELELRTGLPDASLFPLASWRSHTNRALASSQVGAGVYAEPAGDPQLREAIARHVAVSRGVKADASDVVVTNGTQQAVDLICRVLCDPGDRVAVEDPGYEPVWRLFESLGVEVAGIPVDQEGIVVERIPPDARLVYVTPSHQYPLGVVLSPDRRLALLDRVHHTGAVIVEDDYDSEFRFGDRPLEPLQSLDRDGRVIYVGSFSKTMLPTLRLGFAVAPRSLWDALRTAKYVCDWHTALPTQRALASFIDEGDFARHLRRMRATYARRHELVTTTIQGAFAGHLELIPSTVGIHVAARAQHATVADIDQVVERAFERGVAVQPLADFAVAGPPLAGLAIGYGAIPTERIPDALDRLHACFTTGSDGTDRI